MSCLFAPVRHHSLSVGGGMWELELVSLYWIGLDYLLLEVVFGRVSCPNCQRQIAMMMTVVCRNMEYKSALVVVETGESSDHGTV